MRRLRILLSSFHLDKESIFQLFKKFGVLALLGGVCLRPMILWLTNRIDVTHPDTYLLMTVFSDLSRGGPISDWYLPYAPYFIPDWPIALTARIFSVTWFTEVAMVIGLQVLATFVVSRWALKAVMSSEKATASALAGTALLSFFATNRVEPAFYMIVTLHHYGTVLLAIAALGITVRLVSPNIHKEETNKIAKWLAFGLLIAASTLSDRIFLPHFVAPMAASLAFAAATKKIKIQLFLTWLGTTVASVIVGLLTAKAILKENAYYKISGESNGFGKSAREAYMFFRGQLQQSWLIPLTLLALIVFLFGAVHLLRSKKPDFQTARVGVISCFVPLAIASTWAAQVALTTLPTSTRYQIPNAAYPLLLISAPLSLVNVKQLRFFNSELLQRTNVRKITYAIISLWLLSFFVLSPGRPQVNRYDDHMHCLDEQLEKSGSRRGISAFGDAPLIMAQSRHDLEVTFVDGVLRLIRGNQTTHNFSEIYDFAVSSAQYGPPAHLYLPLNDEPEIVNCGLYTVYDFGPNGMRTSRLTSYETLIYDGCDLAKSMGEVAPTNCDLTAAKIEELGQNFPSKGKMSHGPYVKLAGGGRYKATFVYSSELDKSQTAASWDVAVTHISNKPVEVMSPKNLPGTNGSNQKSSHVFFVDDKGFSPVLEVRAQLGDDPSFVIHEVHIERLQGTTSRLE